MSELSNTDLTLDRIPDEGADWSEIGEFALTFDGYEAFGSFDRCAEIANARKHYTLSELRACLFFEQRRWRHFGEDPEEEGEMDYIRELVRAIRQKVTAEERT